MGSGEWEVGSFELLNPLVIAQPSTVSSQQSTVNSQLTTSNERVYYRQDKF
ncbi:MAG: hypothetical protein KME64_24490 [Scytonematopsis contorta HA4267-MV1]|nr:hypothetical protein [Scytonematopsis contorta HA4267-MV1]